MVSTAQLGLPLLMPAQAQKHVYVNEALAKLDAMAQLRIASSTLLAPPATAKPGESYLVPAGATGDWADRDGAIATFVNGGWVFTLPRPGWKAWDEEAETARTYDGRSWIANAVAVGGNGAASIWRVETFDHAVASGPANLTEVTIPANGLVFGVTGRVVEELVGPGLSAWRLGVAASDNRYGSGLGTGINSYVHGLTGSPLVYYEDTPLLISAEAGGLESGTIRFAVHLVELRVPTAV